MLSQKSRVHAITLLQRAVTILQLFAATQMSKSTEEWLTKLRSNKRFNAGELFFAFYFLTLLL